ncbi:MAG: sulfurtransferase TusA family protein [Actinomycetes bacterium]
MADEVSKVVDAKGKSCPMPVLMARKGIDEIESGQVMLVESTDAGSKSDIPSWSRDMGHELLSIDTVGPVYTYTIRKK